VGAHIFVSWLNPYKEQKLVVVGDRGMMVFDDTAPLPEKLIHYPHTINWENGIPVPQKAESMPIDLSDIWDEPLKLECRAFLKGIETGDEPVTSGLEGLRVLKILETSQKSIEQKENRNPSDLKSKPSPPASDFFVHPTAIIDDNVAIGKGTKIWHFSHVLAGSKVGEKCNIGQNVVVGPGATIGNNCKLQNNVSVYKGVTLEDGVFCGPSMVFTNVYNPRAELSKMDQLRPTLVRKGASLGANCTIVCGHTIGRYAFIGAGAVVTKDVPDHALMVGNPARQIGWMCECGERLDEYRKCKICNRIFNDIENKE
jgi:UDP-2-acetamido-3-amino-2,3-dideoxy-glucuronate N-acetyltransferase